MKNFIKNIILLFAVISLLSVPSFSFAQFDGSWDTGSSYTSGSWDTASDPGYTYYGSWDTGTQPSVSSNSGSWDTGSSYTSGSWDTASYGNSGTWTTDSVSNSGTWTQTPTTVNSTGVTGVYFNVGSSP